MPTRYMKHTYIFIWLYSGNFASLLSSADFFQNQLFRKILSGIPSECQTVWIQIRLDKMSSLILIQTVCKGLKCSAKKFYRRGQMSHILKILWDSADKTRDKG